MALVPSLDVVQNAEELSSSLNSDDVLEAERELRVASNLVVDLDEALLVFDDFENFSSGKRVLQAVAKNDFERDALTLLVRARRRFGRVLPRQLIKHPVRRCVHSLQVFF